MKNITLTIFLLCTLPSLAQSTMIGEVLDSLQHRYSLYPVEYPRITESSRKFPPPPSLNNPTKLYSEIECIEACNIPKEELIKYYPWDADSIIVSTNEKLRLGVLSKEQTKELVHTLYNFDIKIDTSITYVSTTSIIGSGMPIANFTFTFHHANRSFFADFFHHIDNPIRILDSSYMNPYESDENAYSIGDDYSTYIYWGLYNPVEQFEKTESMIETVFGITIGEGKDEMDYYEEVPIMDLTERDFNNQ